MIIAEPERQKLETLFNERSAKVETYPEYWVRNADEGRSFCRECCEKEVEKLLKADPAGEYEIDGGYGVEGDSTPDCETCGKTLENSFTDDACKEELQHFLENGVESDYDYLSLSKMISARGWEPYPDTVYRDEFEKKSDLEYFEGLHKICRIILEEEKP